MIWTHVWWCGRSVWRFLTLARHNALPHLGRAAWRLKAAAIVVPGVCVGPVFLPPLWGPPDAPAERPLVMERPWTELGAPTPVHDVPEPGTLVVLLVGVGGLIAVRRWM